MSINKKLSTQTTSSRIAKRKFLTMQYIKQFGVYKGLISRYKLSKYYRAINKSTITKIDIPQAKIPIIIRNNTSDIEIFKQIFVEETYKLPINIKPKVIVDGGAYVGYSSLYFASKYLDAQIISIEPQSSNFELLKKHTFIYPNIKAIQAGIWHQSTSLKIENPEVEQWAFRVQETDSMEESIEAVTIEDIMKLANTDHIDILKLDIEGAEKELFSYGGKWIGKFDVLIIELHEGFKPGCSKALYTSISNYDFQEFRRGENLILIKDFLRKV